MIIDLILDRLNGKPYKAESFYRDVMQYESIFKLDRTISFALDYGTNKEIQRALCKYIDDHDYNHAIKCFIMTTVWI